MLRSRPRNGARSPRIPGPSRYRLQQIEATEAQIQAGVMHLASVHPGVSWAIRINAGAVISLRPSSTAGWRGLRAQIERCIAAGLLNREQVAWVRLAPPGTPDIVGQSVSGRAFGLEVKRRGKAPTSAQAAALDRISSDGGHSAVVSSVDDAERLFSAWAKMK